MTEPVIESYILSNDKKNLHAVAMTITFDNEYHAVQCQKFINEVLKTKILDKFHGDSMY